MDPSRYALVAGMSDTRATLGAWRAAPWAALRPWLLGSLAVAVGLLYAVWVIARTQTADPGVYRLPGLTEPATLGAVGHVLFRNSLVLALHSMACVAGFIAGSSLPLQAEQHSGIWRRVHEKAGPMAIAFVVGATAFSLCTQAYVLGGGASSLAAQLHVSPATLMLTLLPHAVPELVALFLPLAAWMVASRRGDWHQLLAATVVTTVLAAPVLVAAALVEVLLWPELLRSVSPVA
jgi:hypothetical protein